MLRLYKSCIQFIDLARKGNKYLQEKEPWKKASAIEKMALTPTEINAEADFLKKQIDNSLHVSLQLTANLSILINPFLPFTSKKMNHMMKVVDKMMEWKNAGKTKLLSVGYSLRAPELLFRKIEEDEITAQVIKLKEGQIKTQPDLNIQTNNKMEDNIPPVNEIPTAVKPQIVYDDFAKLDLKVGTITAAEKVEKADKLLKLEIDLGYEKRTVVSGIALHFNAAEIVGKQVVLVANLAPRKMRGIESNGMILMAEDKSGKLYFVSPESVIDAGSGVS